MKKYGFLIIVAIGDTIWLIYNLLNNDKFFEASLMQILTLFVAIFISYFLVQQKNDNRRKVDFINRTLHEVMLLLEDEKLLDSDRKKTLVIQKSIANRLQAIEKNSFKEIKQDMDYVVKEFEEIRELYSNHTDNLGEVEMDINRHKINISDKCIKIEAELFNI